MHARGDVDSRVNVCCWCVIHNATRVSFFFVILRARAIPFSRAVSADARARGAGLLGCGPPAYPAGWPAHRTGRKGTREEDLPRKGAGGEAVVRLAVARAPFAVSDRSITRRPLGCRKRSTWIYLRPPGIRRQRARS